MRRHFGLGAAGLCARDGILKANYRRAWPDLSGLLIGCRQLDSLSDGICYSIKQFEQSRKPKVKHGPHRLLRYFEIE
jgi:hypothetical protein